VAIVGVVIALSQQVTRDLVITGVIIVVSVLYYAANRQRLSRVAPSGVARQPSVVVETGE